MPDATIAALKAYNDKNIVLICGGNDKELLFNELADQASLSKLRAVIWLPGTATAMMQKLFTEQNVSEINLDAASMKDAVWQASQQAKAGDIILMSPGATSFGLFQHEFDRGNKFKEAVLQLT
jgi:UDP-N-acetylmuramoylalanine--D-glutamate ligase